MPKIKNKWLEMRINKWLAWLHKFVITTTLPIRRFWFILIGVIIFGIILAIIPLYYGVGFKHISNWYSTIFNSSETQEAHEKTEQIISTGMENSAEILAEPTENIENKADNHRRFAIWNVPEFKKADYRLPKHSAAPKTPLEKTQKAFAALAEAVRQKTQEINAMPKKISDSAPAQKSKDSAPSKSTQQITSPETVAEPIYFEGKIEDYYEILENHNLVYLNEPEIINGSAEIVGPNSLYVNNTFMFLYGIYSDPDEYDISAAEQYFRDLTSAAPIHCEVVAYALQTNTATALCFVNGYLINKSMVNHNFARNVALK